MRHPLFTIPRLNRARIFWPLLIITLALLVTLNLTGETLRTDAAPLGITSYEIAGDVATSQAILDSWDPIAKIYAAFNLGLDYLFLVAYSTTIALALVWIADLLRLSNPLLLAFLLLASAQWLAAVLDGIENAVLMKMLVDSAEFPWPQIAWWCATIKFGLVILGLAFTLAGLAAHFIQKRRRPSE